MMKMHAITAYVILSFILVYTSCELSEPEPVYVVAEEPIIEQEEITMEVKALQEYENYYHTGNKIFGIDDAGLHPIVVMDTNDKPVNLNSFAVIDSIIYLSVKTYEQGDPIPDTDPVQYKAVEVFYYFCQEDDVISVIDVTDFPETTNTNTIELDSKPYKIVTGDYKGMPISSVYQNTLKMNHMPVDGYVVNNMGLYFHVTAPSGTKAGLWCWPVGGNPRWVKELGRLW